ncbi:hypothetical protein RvY_02224 [Ramazzottius varieornatus]|uniref:Uncharacterized protein n=1 Tax=Ramazzottius varieornatus TaxID=947166 RepID=A0A1D1UU55_RAMVA|nr:hypothetical protein RvY_02224 [Ramazzottius varieornatus]
MNVESKAAAHDVTAVQVMAVALDCALNNSVGRIHGTVMGPIPYDATKVNKQATLTFFVHSCPCFVIAMKITKSANDSPSKKLPPKINIRLPSFSIRADDKTLSINLENTLTLSTPAQFKIWEAANHLGMIVFFLK